MGSYKVRFAGKAIKNAPKGKKPMMDAEDMDEEEAMPPKEKMKIGHPEKAVVKNMMAEDEGLPTPNRKKARKEVGEKGSSKSGNYGHAGIPGHQDGSRPRGSGAGKFHGSKLPGRPKPAPEVTVTDAENARATVLNKFASTPDDYKLLDVLNMSGLGNVGRQAVVDLAAGKISIRELADIVRHLPKR